jgi:chromosome partitioning protein
LVPCRPSVLDLDAIKTTLELCEIAKRPALIVLSSAPIRSKVVDEAREAIERRGGCVAPTIIRQRVAFQHCFIDGSTASEFEPDGAAAAEVVSLCVDVGLPACAQPHNLTAA